MKKTLSMKVPAVSLLLLMMVAVVAGCAGDAVQEVPAESAAPSEPGTVTIVDSMGETISVPYKPERVISLYGPPTEVLYALGCESNIAGVSSFCKFPPFVKDKSQVGAPSTPSVEKIVELNPDVIFAFRSGYGADLDPDIEAKIEQTGIPVVFINCLEPEEIPADIQKLGKIFGKEAVADSFTAAVMKPLEIVQERVSDLDESEKKKVYIAAAVDDLISFARGMDGNAIVEMAGGINIAADAETKMPRISPEWLVEEQPDVLVRMCRNCDYDTSNTDSMQETLVAMTQSPGFNKLDAVTDGRVYALSVDLLMSPRVYVEVAYLAKWFYPELFEDIDPEALHREIIHDIYGLELQGAWAYPYP